MNASARLLTGTRKKQHVTPILASLNWLPAQFRIDFKGLVHQKNENSVSIYSPSCCSDLRSSSEHELRYF